MHYVYCIPGLGADEKVFSGLQIPDAEVVFLKWMVPCKNESIDAYAKRLAKNIIHPNPVLIGLSFGGIICIEIAKQLQAKCVIIISSIKSEQEMPLWMQVSAKMKLNKILPMRSFALIRPVENYNLGISTRREKLIVNTYRKNVDRKYSDWAINTLLNWKSGTLPANVFHIHGNRDRIFSIKNIKPDYVIQNGGHLMIMNKPEDVNKCILSILINQC